MVIVLLFALGLCIGSFLNVAIWRIPRRLSVVRPPSHCPSCDAFLRARDLVPVVSWLLLRGRCRSCAAPISVRYPVVELTTAVLFAAVGVRFGASWALPAYLVFVAVAVVLAGIDLDTMTLPRRIIYGSGVAAVVLLAVAAVATGEPSRLTGAAIGAGGALLFFLVLHLIAPGGMGFGDVRLAGLIGLHLGWLGLLEVPTGLFLGFGLGAVFGLGWLAYQRAALRTHIPFGPFLAAGAVLTVLWGQPLVALWYRG
jgi:leader peptidase (prepilin peptidase) / N-methyltransferase